MPASEYADYLEFACRVAAAAGAAILPHFRQSIDVEDKGGKADYDPVTEADRLAEAVIRAEIGRVYPTHGIFGEEHGRTHGASPLTWVIDPIDGTRSFILGQLHWGTLIALHDGERPVVGVMHQPFVGETFAGAIGVMPQWRRGRERRALKTRPCAQIEDAVIATTASFRRRRKIARLPQRDRRRAAHSLRRRLLLLHAARDGNGRYRD